MSPQRRPTDAAASERPAEAGPLAPLLQAYLDHVRVQRRLSARTLVIYTDGLRRLQALAEDAGIDLLQLSSAQARRWAARLHASSEGRAGLGPRSIALLLSVWRGLYRWLGREGRVAFNPFDGLRPPKSAKPLPKALAVDDAVQLASYRDDSAGQDPRLEARDHALVELLYGCGLRVGELEGLDACAGPQARGWLDLESAEAHVLGKGAKRRSVPIGQAALQAVRAWLALRPQLAAAQEPALFVGPRGARLGASQIRLRLKARALAAGMPTHVHPHMLRHSFASHVLQSSGDLRAVQELLGHAHITTTQIYTQLDFQHLARVYDSAHPRAKKQAAPSDKP
ncbi:recombinase XerC [Paucibacter aquatile]|uniref:Tyrosine recombinase XerC n=1 Tax=Kinneretia aquatilis TaxID=2070761 RepID=A0A2N8KY45_9BURK|nr:MULTISPECIES: tyrosine recombinase XerC [Roseateles]PND38322.1 recombinase XerC [Paucibacter aquatile]